MSSCVAVATETHFQLLTSTSQEVSTTFSTSITTSPPTTSTSLSTVCLASASLSSSAGCQSSTVSTVLVTSPGGTSIVSVPVVVTVPVVFTTSVPTQTLFSTSCAASLSSSPTTSATTSIPPSSITSTSLSPSGPSPSSTSSLRPLTSRSILDSTTFTTSSSTTLPNGVVVVTSVVVTSVLPQSSVVVTPQPAPSLNDANGSGKTSSKTAPIVGGVVGGVIAILAVIGGIWFIWRRSKRWNDLFDEELDDKERRRPRMVLDNEDVNPRPYHYGLVGHSDTPSPPRSPLGSMDLGNSFSNSIAALNPPLSHSRSSSGGALSTGESMSRQTPSPMGHVSRSNNLSTASSTAASTRPLLQRPVNRPPSSWSVGGQNVRQDVSTHSRHPSATARPNSAGGALQSPVTGATTDPVSLTPPTIQPSEKSRLLTSLPPGAASPVPPSTSAAGELVSCPPVRPRGAKRPSTAPSTDAVVVHSDAGPASTTPREGPTSSASNAPPAYTPT